LSGGQRQRVAFARALATQPHLLLLDEPFAAIDAKVRKELRSWLRELISQVGITSIFVTHDQEEAIEVADEIIITNQGRIEQIGSPVEVYSNPQTPFVAQFLGDPVTITDYSQFKGFHSTFGGNRAIIRPEFVTVTKKKEFNPYPVTTEEGVVEHVSFRGNALELKVRVHGEQLVASRQLGQELVKEGEKVNVFLQRIYLVNDNGERVATSVNEALRKEESVVI
jgi:sulfate transport system ATP-binding protein